MCDPGYATDTLTFICHGTVRAQVPPVSHDHASDQAPAQPHAPTPSITLDLSGGSELHDELIHAGDVEDDSERHRYLLGAALTPAPIDFGPGSWMGVLDVLCGIGPVAHVEALTSVLALTLARGDWDHHFATMQARDRTDGLEDNHPHTLAAHIAQLKHDRLTSRLLAHRLPVLYAMGAHSGPLSATVAHVSTLLRQCVLIETATGRDKELVRQGDPAQMIVVLQGDVLCSTSSSYNDDKDSTKASRRQSAHIHTVSVGRYVGDQALLHNTPSAASVTCPARSVVLMLAPTALEALWRTAPKTATLLAMSLGRAHVRYSFIWIERMC
jgi:hypothetical protein